MTELDYIIQSFDLHFSAYQGCKIALSPGEYLDPVVDAFGQRYCFHCILGPEDTEVPEGTDLVILTDRRTSKEPDYHRICKSCEEKRVPLLDLFGLDQLALHHELWGHRHLTVAQWKELLREYDVISLFIPNVVANFDAIQGRWVLRYRFPTLFNWLKREGKTVVVFWEDEGQYEPLREEGIEPSVTLLKRQGNDLGFLALAEQYANKRIIHVGVGTVRDGIVPREYGIDSRLNRYCTSVSSGGRDTGFYEDRRQLVEAIDAHDVVSFRIFDTLLKRTVLYPEDVFEMAEERVGVRGFADRRHRIQTSCPQLSLEGIYGRLKEAREYDSETLAQLQQAELAVESDVIGPRSSMVELFDYAVSHGKTVVLVGDNHHGSEFLRELLRRCGITGYSALHLACNNGSPQHEGWSEVLQGYKANGRTVLGIGDETCANALSATGCDLDEILVPSCLEMAKRNGYAAVLDRCRTLAGRKLLGLGVANGFDNPFEQETDAQIANMIVAPLAMSYLQWACDSMMGKGYDRFLLSSRDGWMLLDAYGKLQQRFSEQLPPALYFYANRHAALLTAMDDYRLVQRYFSQIEYRDDPPELLRQFLRIPPDRLSQYKGERLEDYYRANLEVIREVAERYREHYKRYMAKEGIGTGRYAVMDFVSEGSTMRMLGRSLASAMDGYFVGRPEYASRRQADIRYFLDRDLMSYDTEMRLEVYFTSPEPALDFIGDEGNPVFAGEVRDGKTLRRIGRVQELVRAYLNQYLDMLYEPRDRFDRDLIFQLCEAINRYDVENCYFDDMLEREIRTRV